MHKFHSGTAVYSECLDLPADQSVWMEPGSALVLQQGSLDDYVHGIPSRRIDSLDPTKLSNAHLVSSWPAMHDGSESNSNKLHGGTSADETHLLTFPRQPRVSIVLWTDY